MGAGLAASALGFADSADDSREKRMQWWHDARFGMFIHWGLYSVVGRHEWVMEEEAIPVAEYEQLAKRFTPKPNAARAWAKLARQAGSTTYTWAYQRLLFGQPVRLDVLGIGSSRSSIPQCECLLVERK